MHVAREIRFGPIQQPAVGDREHRLALLAHPAQVPDEILERVERLFFLAAFDHLVGDAAVVVGAAVGTCVRQRPG